MPHSEILIVTVSDDLHSAAVHRELESRQPGISSVLNVDKMSQEYEMMWTPARTKTRANFSMSGESVVDVSSLKAIWWRRVPSAQITTTHDEVAKDLINRGYDATVRGLLDTAFKGVWISHPLSTIRAANKLVQLQSALRAGLNVPRTLITDKHSCVTKFFDICGGHVIAKPVVGSHQEMVFTQSLASEDLSDVSGISAMPTIYQELVPGTQHLRINVFGNDVYAARIDSPILDWRPDVSVPVEPIEISEALSLSLVRLLKDLDIRMGAFDLKISSEDGLPYWIEVNPQGQFLFLEGLAGMPLTSCFADYLLSFTDVGG